MARPILREHEIECFGRSGCPTSNQVAVSDLLVTVSRHEILLYSQRLRKRVIPYLTSAHACTGNSCPSAYQLLAHLQYTPGTNVPTFDWGRLRTPPFLPRVRSGRVVFVEARWNIFA